MELRVTPEVLVRDMRLEDARAIARHADDLGVAANMRDLFPHPYVLEDAIVFINQVLRGQGEFAYTIEIGGEALGVISFKPGMDVYRHSAEIGYWIGREYWGRGIMTKVVRAFVAWMRTEHEFVRLFAGVFSSNPASGRVLEKCGFAREGVLKKHIFKNGEWQDEWVYALLFDPSR